jgi:hypothetical protein
MTEPGTVNVTDSVATASSGCHSSASQSPSGASEEGRDSVAHADRSATAPDGWSFDERPVFGHSVERYAVNRELDLHIALTAGEASSPGPTSFDVPEVVLRWLLTGGTAV